MLISFLPIVTLFLSIFHGLCGAFHLSYQPIPLRLTLWYFLAALKVINGSCPLLVSLLCCLAGLTLLPCVLACVLCSSKQCCPWRVYVCVILFCFACFLFCLLLRIVFALLFAFVLLCFALCFVFLSLLHVDLLLCCCFLFFIHKDRMVGHVWLPLFNTILEVELARHVSCFALHWIRPDYQADWLKTKNMRIFLAVFLTSINIAYVQLQKHQALNKKHDAILALTCINLRMQRLQSNSRNGTLSQQIIYGSVNHIRWCLKAA